MKRHRTPVPWVFGRPQLLGLIAAVVVCVQTPLASAQDQFDDNIVIILDASGSMGQSMPGSSQTKMAVAKEALAKVLQQVPSGTNVGLLVFGSKKDWLYPLGPVEQNRIKQAIMLLKPSGGTPLGEYLKKGADRLLQQRQKQHGYGTYRLLVVTDGEASDKELVDRYLPDLLSRGIIVDVVGVAMASTHELATKVHSYRRADDPAALARALRESIGEISTSQDDTSADADSFAMLAALPQGMADAMLGALHNSGNHPIGQTSATQGPRHSTANRRPPSGQARDGTVTYGNRSTDRDGGRPWAIWAIVAVVVLIILVRLFKSAAGRSRQ